MENEFNGIGLDDLEFDFTEKEEEIEEVEVEEEIEVEEETVIEKVDGKEKEKPEAGNKDKDIEDPEKPEGEKGTEEEVNPLVVITDYLHEKGIVDKPEDFEPTDENFEKLIVEKINKGIDEYKNGLNGVSKDFLDFVENGGDPSKFIAVYAEQDFSTLKLSDIQTVEDADEDVSRDGIRKEIIKESLRMQGLTEEKIIAKIKRYEDTGVLAEEAVDALDVVKRVSMEKKEAIVEQQRNQAKAKQDAFDKWVSDTTTLIENELDKIVGIEIPKRKKDEFKEFLLKINPKTKKTPLMEKREKDPHFDIKMAFAAYDGFEVVKKGAEKVVKSTLADKLKSATSKQPSVTPRTSSQKAWSKLVED